MKNNFLWTVLVGFVLHSCVFIRMDDSIDLGDNYRLIQDNPKVIIYNTNSTSKSSGVNIVPPVVLSVSLPSTTSSIVG